MEDKINEIHKMIKETFPDAISVQVFVNSQGIDINPTYKTNLDGYSMKNINGEWVRKSE